MEASSLNYKNDLLATYRGSAYLWRPRSNRTLKSRKAKAAGLTAWNWDVDLLIFIARELNIQRDERAERITMVVPLFPLRSGLMLGGYAKKDNVIGWE